MKQKGKMPLPVYWELYGINSRASSLGFMWASVALALGSIAYGCIDPLAFQGAVFLVAAGWYWYAIRWADKNSGWDKPA
jgi:hypothetical protein